MNNEPIIKQEDPVSPMAQKLMNALREEIQTRNSFKAPNPFDPVYFSETKAGLWVAFANNEPVGSIVIEMGGFTRIAAFGKWINANTGICFQKELKKCYPS